MTSNNKPHQRSILLDNPELLIRSHRTEAGNALAEFISRRPGGDDVSVAPHISGPINEIHSSTHHGRYTTCVNGTGVKRRGALR
jgi:hypothetical protein